MSSAYSCFYYIFFFTFATDLEAMRTLISLILGIVLLQVEVLAQTVSGTVTDAEGQTLIGAAVIEKGTSNGVLTDLDGSYSIKLSNTQTAVLQFSYTGFKTQDKAVNGQSILNIVLMEEAEAMNEVIVVGYGKSTKKEFTGASSNIKGRNLEKISTPRVDQALQGQIAGVNISTNSGSPGGSSSIRIRGLSTFGDNDPLILVDGVIYDSEGLNSLNTSDIESINVLKDATAGIYGVRAANGVILITTKQGSKNSKPKFEVNMYQGVQQPAKQLALLNASEYAVIKNEMFANGNDPLPFQNTFLGEGTDWQNEVFTNAPVSNVNFTASGGTQNMTYSVGGSYYSQDGIVGGSKANFERLNARMNFNVDMSEKLRLRSVFLYSNETRNVLPENGIGSVLYNSINAFPTEAVRDTNGNYSYLEEVSDIINPIAQMENTYNTAWVNKFVGKEEVEYDLRPNLTFTNRFSYNYALVDNKVFSPLVWYGPGKAQNTAKNADLEPTQVEIATGTFIDRGASVYEGRSTYSDLTFESFINHEKTFANVHQLKTTVGISVFGRNGQGLGGTAYNIPGNSEEYADISANLAPGGFLNNTNSFQYRERLLSAFLRANYRFTGKWTASAILRRDGSSKFGPNNRYGLFPTVSGSWVLSEEKFYHLNYIKFMKLRMSYGISGNDQIDNFAYRGLLNGEGVYVFDDVITNGVAIGRASNPDLKWETTRQFNLGLDMKMWAWFDITLNYFVKNTRDLLFQPDVSGVQGTGGPGSSAPIINAGDVQNSGVEMELVFTTPSDKDWKISTGLNATYLKNIVKKTPDGVDFLPGAAFGVGGNIATRFQEGFPIGYFIGYETDGIFQTQAEIDASETVQEGAKPGDLKFVDQNGDGKISFSDDSDLKMIGSPIPDFTFGLFLTANWKDFDLSANLFAAVGQEIIRNYERQQPFANQLSYVIDRWNFPGSSNEVPRVTTDLTRNNVFSDYFVEDGSFVRLRNIQIGYTFRKVKKLNSVRLYVAANNLFTITNYRGYDPDIGSVGGALGSGVDLGFYPQAHTYMSGLIVKF